MALKKLMLRRELDAAKAKLSEVRAKDAEFQTREQDLEAAIDEVETADEQAALENEIEKFEQEKAEHDEEAAELEKRIGELEEQLAEEDAKEPILGRSAEKKETRTEVQKGMNLEKLNLDIRSLPLNRKAFDVLSIEQRSAIVAQPDVQDFLTRLRSMENQTRAVTGAELAIPVVLLDLIAENLFRYSKLLNRVRLRVVDGQARQTVAGTIPEAVWTEMCSAINELNFTFNQVTLDGYKVAGYVPVCNSVLEDNDVNLAGWIVEMLGESIGLAVDKAILYGKGSAAMMPTGIVTRLAQTAKPADYPANAPEWIDLHTTNVLQIGGADVTGAEFWAELMGATAATYNKYARGTMFWAMNSKTYAQLRSKVITFTATGDIAANIFGVLPIVNGDIDILEFMPDGDIVGGYGDLYLFAQRGGMVLESSTEVQFIQDNTVFRGKMRGDGAPIIPQAFVAININNTAVTTTMDFAMDTANDAQLNDLAISGVTLTPSTFDPTVYTYTGATTTATGKIEATPAQAGAQVAISYNGANVRNGGTITWESSALPVTVTVTQGNAVRVYTITVTKSGN